MHVYIAMTRRGQPPKRIPKRSLRHNLLWLYLQSLANTVVTHVFNKKVTTRREWFEELGLHRAVAAQWASMGTFGRTGHNGVALCGTPGAAMIAADCGAGGIVFLQRPTTTTTYYCDCDLQRQTTTTSAFDIAGRGCPPLGASRWRSPLLENQQQQPRNM